MCGIAAIFAYGDNAGPVEKAELLSIRDHMVNRGPDDQGLWVSECKRIGFGHRRLSIIDLSDTGSQPMATEDGSVVICYNGEIYNYRELRSDLEKSGFRFRSSSDTEVLLNLYRQKGMKMLHDLRGMYALSLWDRDEQTLFLARDPFGIKPLYYADNGLTVRAASQVKALLAGGSITNEVEPAGHVGFFIWGHVPEPFTLYREIRALPAGSVLRIDRKTAHSQHSTQPQSFCSISQILESPLSMRTPISADEAPVILGQALRDSVCHHLVADVPVGVFLSSGIDSTILAALVSETGYRLKTLTLGFEEYRGTHEDEVPLAEKMAHQINAEHQTVWVTKRDFQSELNNLLNAMDQPTLDGVNSYLISMAAKHAGLKVVLSGLGGDEIFGGYPGFKQIPMMVRYLGFASAFPTVSAGVRKVCAPLASIISSPKYAGILEYGCSFGGAYLLRRSLFMPWELPELFNEDFVSLGLNRLQLMASLNETIEGNICGPLKVSALELSWYLRNQLLRDADWASMAHSLEVRVPLIDLPLLNVVSALATAGFPQKKADVARIPHRKPPAGVLKREKTGFSVPIQYWLQGDDPRVVRERGLRGWAKMVYGSFQGSMLRKSP